jgi:predicted transcriptional regulator
MDPNDPKQRKLQKIENLFELKMRIKQMHEELAQSVETVSSEMRSRALLVDLDLDEFNAMEEAFEECFAATKAKIDNALVNIA